MERDSERSDKSVFSSFVTQSESLMCNLSLLNGNKCGSVPIYSSHLQMFRANFLKIVTN